MYDAGRDEDFSLEELGPVKFLILLLGGPYNHAPLLQQQKGYHTE
jgi:hypothetical protein